METIYTLSQLLYLIESKELNSKQICKVLSEGFQIYADEEQSREILIKELEEYDIKYSNSPDKPLFLGEVDIEEYLKENEIKTRLWTEYKTTKAAIIASIHRHKGCIVGSNENNTYYLHGKPCVQFSIPHPNK